MYWNTIETITINKMNSTIYQDVKKHTLKFYDETNKAVIDLGVVRSYSEPNKHRYSELLYIKRMVNISDYENNENDKFYIQIHPENKSGKIRDLLAYLEKNRYKSCLLQFHSSGAEAIITSSDINIYGFTCAILQPLYNHTKDVFNIKYGNIDDNDDYVL
jgi:hypothetical protein